MAEVTISLNGRPYEITCDEGQEGRVVALAAHLDKRVQQVARSGGAQNDVHLQVLAALVVTDELFETQETLRAQQVAARQPQPRQAPPVAEGSQQDEKALASVLDQLAKRIEGIAVKVKTA